MSNRRRLLLGILCSLATTILMGFNVSMLGKIVQAAQNPGPTSLSLLDRYAAWAGFLSLGIGICSYGKAYFVNSASQKVIVRLRNEVYAHLQQMGLRFFDRHKTGQLMATITADIPQIQNAAGPSLVDSIDGPFRVIGGVGYLIWINWQLALISAVLIPVIAILIGAARRRMRRATNLMQSALADISDILEETLTCVRVIRAFVTEDAEVLRFQERSSASYRAYMRGVRVQSAMRPTVEFIGTVGIITAVWLGERLILTNTGGLTLAHLLEFVILLNYIGQACGSVGGLTLAFQQANVAAERVFSLLDETPDVQDRPGASPIGPIQGSVEFRNVTFSYGSEPVLRNVSFAVHPGEVLAIVGPSGAGKSTIANLIPRFYDVDSGAVVVDGHNIQDVTMASLRKQIGIVPQESVLFAMSLRENIAYGRPDASLEDVREAARSANALEFIESQPDGFETVVGQRGATLSGGQRQRIAIARALLNDPRILLLDEATSSLDAQSESVVQAALDRLMEGRTTIIIAHRLSTVRNADRILVLSGGEVAEVGQHQELLAQNGIYASLYRRQMEIRDVGPVVV